MGLTLGAIMSHTVLIDEFDEKKVEVVAEWAGALSEAYAADRKKAAEERAEANHAGRYYEQQQEIAGRHYERSRGRGR